MRTSNAIFALLAACCPHATKPPTVVAVPPLPATEVAKPAPAPAPPPATPEVLAADTPRTTTSGATFIAPVGWSIVVRGSATILETPEKDSRIALIDTPAKDADEAVALAWATFQPDAKRQLRIVTPSPDKDGWTDRRTYSYITSPNETRDVGADTYHHDTTWTVAIYDVTQATGQKRGAQIELIYGRLLPPSYERETFAGKKANPLDAARIAALAAFVETARTELEIPGVAIGLVQAGKVVFAGGFGTRELGKPAKVDGDTLFIIASNTKALTTLMLAKLVDEGKLTWDKPVVDLLSTFALGDKSITSKVMVKHLVCACTGLPRQDLEWLLDFGAATPASEMSLLGSVKPTTGFGEMFQYSNLLAAAAGFVGGHLLFPDRELGDAYDEAMRTRVFSPLGMTSTTFDFKRALRGNHAGAYAWDIDGKPAEAASTLNYSMVPLRPAGGAWSNVRDILRYLAMELASGDLPDGKHYISKSALLERRVAQVPIGKDGAYLMGLARDTTYGIPVIHHGGSMIGFKTDMIFLPGHDVGAVILTNSDTGQLLLGPFRRRLLEILFDGKLEAAADVAAAAKNLHDDIAAERKRDTVPADATEAAKLAGRYTNASFSDLVISHQGAVTTFQLGELRSPVASRKNPDGSVSFITMVPGFVGAEFVAGDKTLTLHDAQHDYVFTASASTGDRKPCLAYGLLGFGVSGPNDDAATQEAYEAASQDLAAAGAANDKKRYAEAAHHYVDCGLRYRKVKGEEGPARACYSNALYSYAMAGRLAAEGRANLLRAAKADPKNAAYLHDELATAPPDCKVE